MTDPGDIYRTRFSLSTQDVHELVPLSFPATFIVWTIREAPDNRDPRTNMPETTMLVSWSDHTEKPNGDAFEIRFTTSSTHWQAVDRPELSGQIVELAGQYVANDPNANSIETMAEHAAKRLAQRREYHANRRDWAHTAITDAARRYIDDQRAHVMGSITYPMRARPDGMAVAIRAGINDTYPWWITTAGTGGLYVEDSDVADWTPLVRQPTPRDDPDAWVPYTPLMTNVGDDEVREYLAGPPASVDVDATLALIQTSLTAQTDLLRALTAAGLLLPPTPPNP